MSSLLESEKWSSRVLGPGDHMELIQLVNAVYTKTEFPIGGGWSPEALSKELIENKSLGIFYDHFGLVSFVLWQELVKAKEIRILGTHPQFQKKGLMSDLMHLVMNLLVPGDEIWLEVHESNRGARNLYEKLGFSKVGGRPKYYRDGCGAVLYSWTCLKSLQQE